jgi:hypothetical protein
MAVAPVYTADALCADAAETLAVFARRTHGITLTEGKGGITFEADATLPAEGYTITVTSEDGNVSEYFTVIVYDSYETPIGRRLTPEQFVACVNGIMVENGARINTTIGWRLVVLKPDQLTGDLARSCAEGWVSEFWGIDRRGMGLAYQGVDEDGNHVFYIHR